MGKTKEEIIYFLSSKYDLPVGTIKQIVNSQFKSVSLIIKQGHFDTIKLPYLGKFTVNKKRVEHINKLKDGATRRSNNNKR
jgi:nucleoid DNA-binding protein